MRGFNGDFVKRTGLIACMLRSAILGITGAWFVALPQPLFAATSCSFTSLSPVSFGAYNVFSKFPNNNGVGSITILCQSGGGPSFVVKLSTGQGNSYASRVMVSGGNRLNYNLYTSAARTVVWGDGTGGSNVMTAAKRSTTVLSVFGQIPAGQDATVGTYVDNVTVTVNF
jgi:spore coat protein U-like protein